MKIEPEPLFKPATATAREIGPFKVLLLARSKAAAEEQTAAIAPLRGASVEAVPTLSSLPTILSADSAQPFVLLVEVDPTSTQDLALIRDLRGTAGFDKGCLVALIDRDANLSALQAIRAGADDVLLKPFEIEEAREVFTRVIERSQVVEETAVGLGYVIVFMHFSGGAGATTLAVNSATALAQADTPHNVCLLDLDIQFGNAANLLDLPTASPIQDLVDDLSRLDAQMLDSMMLRHPTGVHVLSAPRVLMPLNIYGADAIMAILDLARQRYEFVVVDLPSALTSWTDTVLRLASIIYVVTPLTVPAAHRFAKFLELLHQDGITGLPMKIVASRSQSGFRHGNDITVAQFEKATGKPVDYLVPDDYALISLSHAQGKPAVQLKPNSAFGEALRAMLAGGLGKPLFGAPRRRFFFR